MRGAHAHDFESACFTDVLLGCRRWHILFLVLVARVRHVLINQRLRNVVQVECLQKLIKGFILLLQLHEEFLGMAASLGARA